MFFKSYALMAMSCFLLHLFIGARGKMLAMRIVDEPTQYQWQQSVLRDTNTPLTAKVKPSNVSGPSHLLRLAGRCFQKEISKYRYEFCAFANVTQHETGITWNPYRGILGVWHEWEINDNRFIAMVMKSGDACGSKDRTAKVTFVCGESNAVDSVSEPTTCNYELVFKTPLVCHEHSVLVYPTLSQQLQHDWNQLEGELSRGEVTDKGYQHGLSEIFQQAGYYAREEVSSGSVGITSEHQGSAAVSAGRGSSSSQHLAAAADGSVTVAVDRNISKSFASLNECNAEYQKLAKELKRLRDLSSLLDK